MPAVLSSAPAAEMSTQELQRRVNDLRCIDNWTNWYYLAREYLFLAAILGLTILFYERRAEWNLPWLWNVPVTLAAIALSGASQHRLATLGHEAVHYMLFRNRILNELVSDVFCMFPLLSSTQYY